MKNQLITYLLISMEIGKICLEANHEKRLEAWTEKSMKRKYKRREEKLGVISYHDIYNPVSLACFNIVNLCVIYFIVYIPNTSDNKCISLPIGGVIVILFPFFSPCPLFPSSSSLNSSWRTMIYSLYILISGLFYIFLTISLHRIL